jgi:hypothetical protein
MHHTTDRFWKCFNNLSEPVQEIAKKNFNLLKSDPYHPSLHFKKTGQFWSARIGLHYRAIAVEDDKDFIWVWIGTHDDYEKMIK